LVTNINNDSEIVPLSYRLSQNYPNPFNPSTTVQFELPRLSKVNLVIFDLLGRKVKTLVNKSVAPGKYEVQWNGRNESGVPVSSGIYILHFRAGKFEQNRRIILLK
jgi:flagellar hook assembly protein FlgD